MNAADVVGGSGSSDLPRTRRRTPAAAPTDLGSLDVRGLRARVEYLDGDPVLLVDDGDVEIEFSSGMGGTWDQAITGAERLAATAAAYAVELRRRGPTRVTSGASRVEPGA